MNVQKWSRKWNKGIIRVLDLPSRSMVFVMIGLDCLEALDRVKGKSLWKYRCPKGLQINGPSLITGRNGVSFELRKYELASYTGTWVTIGYDDGEVGEFSQADVFGKARLEDTQVFQLSPDSPIVAKGAKLWFGEPGSFVAVGGALGFRQVFGIEVGAGRIGGLILRKRMRFLGEIEFDPEKLTSSTLCEFYSGSDGKSLGDVLLISEDYSLVKPYPFLGKVVAFDKSGEEVCQFEVPKVGFLRFLQLTNEVEEAFMIADDSERILISKVSLPDGAVRSELVLPKSPRSAYPNLTVAGSHLLVGRLAPKGVLPSIGYTTAVVSTNGVDVVEVSKSGSPVGIWGGDSEGVLWGIGSGEGSNELNLSNGVFF